MLIARPGVAAFGEASARPAASRPAMRDLSGIEPFGGDAACTGAAGALASTLTGTFLTDCLGSSHAGGASNSRVTSPPVIPPNITMRQSTPCRGASIVLAAGGGNLLVTGVTAPLPARVFNGLRWFNRAVAGIPGTRCGRAASTDLARVSRVAPSVPGSRDARTASRMPRSGDDCTSPSISTAGDERTASPAPGPRDERATTSAPGIGTEPARLSVPRSRED